MVSAVLYNFHTVFQLTTSRRGRLENITKIKTRYYISTHYLTQRQTHPPSSPAITEPISTHYLTQRQTKKQLQQKLWKTFQLTTSRRGRLSSCIAFFNFSAFQLTTSRRGRPRKKNLLSTSTTFQLTTSRRGRRSRSLPRTGHRYFNSLPHAEVDTFQELRSLCFFISTHYLTQRQTIISSSRSILCQIFQLTTSRRGRQDLCARIEDELSISTHYLTQRQTRKKAEELKLQVISTHYLTQRQTVKKLIDFLDCNISTHYLTQRQTNQCFCNIKSRVCTYMFYFIFVIVS